MFCQHLLKILSFVLFRLAVLSQKGEISLLDKPKKEISTPTPTPTPSKTKKAQRIKALSPKVQRDELLEVLNQVALYFTLSTTLVIGQDWENSIQAILLA